MGGWRGSSNNNNNQQQPTANSQQPTANSNTGDATSVLSTARKGWGVWGGGEDTAVTCMVTLSWAVMTWLAGVRGVVGSQATTAFSPKAPKYRMPLESVVSPSLADSFWPRWVIWRRGRQPQWYGVSKGGGGGAMWS